jgi:hypothetical protein
MTPEQIIHSAVTKKGINPTVAINKIHQEMENPHSSLLKHGDTLMLLKKIDEQNADVFFVTEDSPLGLVKAVKYFLNVIRKHGIKMIHFGTGNPKLIQAFSAAGHPITRSNIGTYQFMVTV